MCVPTLLGFNFSTCQALLAAALMVAASPASADPRAVLDLDRLPERGESLLWSPLFQASWDKLNAQHAGGLEEVVPPNALVAKLDKFRWSEREVMPEGAYAIFAGSATAAFAAESAAKIKAQFGVAMAPSRLPERPQGIAIYGILVRDLNFQRQFFRAQRQALEFKDRLGKRHRVEFFGTTGAHSDRYGRSVRVLEFGGAGKSFILSIATDRKGESLIVYRPGHAPSFAAAIEHVARAIGAPLDGAYGSLGDSTIHKFDTIKIPYLELDVETDFAAQLQGARHYRGEELPWRIEGAIQLTRFELSEKGAKLRVESQIGEAPFGDVPEPQEVNYVPRRFICDEPFFVFAWREKAKWPYFASWIDGADWLRDFPSE